jgi:hypothetical protein
MPFLKPLQRFLLLAILSSCAIAPAQSSAPRTYIGFDRNDYPGDASLPALRKHFDFVGFWLTVPPGERQNSWLGKRAALIQEGFGFLVLANGRFDSEIVANGKKAATALGQRDASAAIAAAEREHFPAHTILFLDQEEGGRLLQEQADYLFGWTETVARSEYRPGAYISGQPVDEGHGQHITTAEDIRQHVAAQHLHPIVLWVYQDACPPSNGCALHPPPLSSSGTPGAEVWQYAQSPRRKAITAACAKTFSPDGNCYVNEPGLSTLHLDLSVAASPDPSHGR